MTRECGDFLDDGSKRREYFRTAVMSEKGMDSRGGQGHLLYSISVKSEWRHIMWRHLSNDTHPSQPCGRKMRAQAKQLAILQSASAFPYSSSWHKNIIKGNQSYERVIFLRNYPRWIERVYHRGATYNIVKKCRVVSERSLFIK